MTGDETVRRLYEAAPDGFVEARAALVAEARAAGDREAARRIAALKKPTVAAWIVNLVALRRPDLLDELAGIATALRAAQRDLQGDQMRELSRQRRRFVTALVEAARKLAVETGAAGAKLPLAEVEATFTAALAEPEIADQIRSGQLIRAVSYAGFGEVPRPRLRLVTDDPAEALAAAAAPALEHAPEPGRPDSAPIPPARPDPAAQRRRRGLERAMAAAQDAEQRADQRLRRAEEAERDAGHLVEDLETELAELERRRTEAIAEVARRRQARRTAEREAATARRAVGDAQAALDDLPELR